MKLQHFVDVVCCCWEDAAENIIVCELLNKEEEIEEDGGGCCWILFRGKFGGGVENLWKKIFFLLLIKIFVGNALK